MTLPVDDTWRDALNPGDLDIIWHIPGDRRKLLRHLSVRDFEKILESGRGTEMAAFALVAIDRLEHYGAATFGDLFEAAS